MPGLESEECEERALLLAAEREGAAVRQHLEWAEEAELEHVPVVAPSKTAA